MAESIVQTTSKHFTKTRRQCINKGFTNEEADYIAEAVYHWERIKLFGTRIKPQEGTRVCRRVPGYACGGSEGPFHSECQNQPIYTYDQSKAVKGI